MQREKSPILPKMHRSVRIFHYQTHALIPNSTQGTGCRPIRSAQGIFSTAQKKKFPKKIIPPNQQNQLCADIPCQQSCREKGLISAHAQAGSQDSEEFQGICLKKHKKYVFKILLPFLGQTSSRYSSAGSWHLYFSEAVAHHLNNEAKHLDKQKSLGLMFDGKYRAEDTSQGDAFGKPCAGPCSCFFSIYRALLHILHGFSSLTKTNCGYAYLTNRQK